MESVVASIREGATIKELWLEYPTLMITMEKGIKRCFTELSPSMVTPPRYSLDSFQWTFDKDFSKSIIFWGESGIGKTCFARALLPTALLVSHMDDLLQFNPDKHEGLIFDDMDFKHTPRSAQIHLTDIDEPRSIHCRYQCALIPANTKKIFTTNEDNGSIFMDDPAIKRRTKVINLINFFLL